eukprot:TRINITY_DN6800_c0_g1_i1.p1 TRINITY_DN6800_c0_g1~~TRINITY_DN6800_c0_g1_i1.p1  ORF type:complete len:173 (-),score=32.88 TRINITY_DN6800_c0_g1_i1:55-573(-)
MFFYFSLSRARSDDDDDHAIYSEENTKQDHTNSVDNISTSINNTNNTNIALCANNNNKIIIKCEQCGTICHSYRSLGQHNRHCSAQLPSIKIKPFSSPSTTTSSSRYWTTLDHNRFLELTDVHGNDLVSIAAAMGNKTRKQVETHRMKWLQSVEQGRSMRLLGRFRCPSPEL